MIRSWPIFVLLACLLVIQYFQTLFYFYFENTPFLQNDLLKSGYLFGVLGLWGGVNAILFVEIKGFRVEMGILETFGQSRTRILLYFAAHFFIATLLTYLFSAILSVILFYSNLFNGTSLLHFISLNVRVLAYVIVVNFVSIIIFLTWHTRKDPYLLIKAHD